MRFLKILALVHIKISVIFYTEDEFSINDALRGKKGAEFHSEYFSSLYFIWH